MTVGNVEGENDKGPISGSLQMPPKSVLIGRRPRHGQRLPPDKLDDPSFPAPIYASLVEAEGEELALIWSRRRAAE